jgi:hypothetical protein
MRIFGLRNLSRGLAGSLRQAPVAKAPDMLFCYLNMQEQLVTVFHPKNANATRLAIDKSGVQDEHVKRFTARLAQSWIGPPPKFGQNNGFGV